MDSTNVVSIPKVFRRLALAFGRIGAALVALFFVVVGSSVWQVHKLRPVCDAAVPGTPVSAIVDLVKERGLRTYPTQPVVGKAGTFYVPTTSLMMLRCEIKHDGTAVISAQLENP